MGDVRQLPALVRQFTTIVPKIETLRDEARQLLVDHPTGDLADDIVRQIIHIETSLGRYVADIKTNAAQQEQHHIDASTEQDEIDKVWEDAWKVQDIVDHAMATIAVLRRRDPGLKPAPAASASTHGVPTTTARPPDPLSSVIKLPPQELPQFTGIYSDWPSFWDRYEPTVHTRTGLTDVIKFTYLRQSLSGEPLDLIKMLPVTDINYATAIGILQKRYSDQGMIVRELLEAIFCVPDIPSDNVFALRRFVTTFSEKVQGLKNQGVSKGWFFLSHLVFRKLDQETRRAYDLYQAEKKRWATLSSASASSGSGSSSASGSTDWDKEYDDLMNFLQERVQIWERSSKTEIATAEAKIHQNRRDNHFKSTQRVRANPTNGYSSKTSNYKCQACGSREFHYTSHCPTFIKMSPDDRRQYLKDTNSCYNCLSPNHRVGECRSKGTCRECYERHHTLLHVEKRKSNPASGVQDDDSEENADNTDPHKAVGSPAVLAAQATTIFLCTGQIPCIDAYGGVIMLRAMLHTGSQVEIITADAAEKLGFDIQESTLEIVGVGSTRSQRALGRIDFSILLPDHKQYEVTCDVLNQVVGDLCFGRMAAQVPQQVRWIRPSGPLLLQGEEDRCAVGRDPLPASGAQ